jgi:hypothetical protein
MTWLKARLWAILSAVTAILAVVGAIYGKGRSDANTARQARDAKDYRNERQKIDDEISGIGSTDRERIDRLRDISDRRSGR